LHSYPYRETSLIIETFTRTHGRVAMVAKGAKRPNGAMKGLLNPFQRLYFTWFGKAEMKTLKSVELDRINPQLSGPALMSAFYASELLLKLAHREDAHDALFDAYDETIAGLSGHVEAGSAMRNIAALLRRFETILLRELGYALQLSEEADSGRPIDPSRNYAYLMERGPVPIDRVDANRHAPDVLQLSGKTLLDMASGDFSDSQTQQQAKLLMRRAINHLLGDKPLHTRQLIRDMR
jgi:DNA repair protein RecO (recombination protein O)